MSEGKRVCGFQAAGGTGALRIAGEFLKQEVSERIAISDPTWPNHPAIFTRCGMVVEHYPYYDGKKHKLDFERCYGFLKNLTPGSCVLLQPCCHNPTGLDFSLEQWKSLAALFRQNGLLPFFDFAYQGFGTGIEEDASVIRMFAQEGMELVVAYSMSKNFGLYSERAGALFIVTGDQKTAEAVTSKVKTVIRTNYSNPPRHAASIVAHILSTPALKKKWEGEIESMRNRITGLRRQFVEALVAKSQRRDFSFLLEGKGMFCFTGLNSEEVERIKREFGIYLTNDGRINIAGLSQENLNYVADVLAQL
jgi:aspartate aminotransferase